MPVHNWTSFHLIIFSPSHQGIVTKFVLQAHPQGDVWVIISYFYETCAFRALINELMKGGFVIIPSLYFDEVNAAILKFQQEVTDPKAMALPTYNTVRDVVRVPRQHS